MPRYGYRLAEHVVPAVTEAGQAGPDGPDQADLDLGDRHRRRGPEVSPDHAERVDEHAAPDAGRGPGGRLVRVGNLPHGGDPHGVLDGARSHQRDPVLLLEQPGGPGGGQHQQLGPGDRQRAGQLAEPHVVADGQARAHPGERAHDRGGPRRDQVGLAVPERVEQVQLAVGSDQLAGSVVGHRGVVHPAVRGGLEDPGDSATPVCFAVAASPEQNGPSSGSAAARRSEPNLTWVASGNTARSAPCSAASVSGGLHPSWFTSGRELTGIWHSATRIYAA